MGPRDQARATILPGEITERPHRRHGQRRTRTRNRVDPNITMQHLPGFARLKVHHAGIVHTIADTMRQQGVVRDRQYRGMNQQSLNRSRLRKQRPKPLGELAIKLFVPVMRLRKIGCQIGFYGSNRIGIDRITHDSIPILSNRRSNRFRPRISCKSVFQFHRSRSF